MKNTLVIALALFLLTGTQALAQLPEDVIRMSWQVPSGTARNQAIGGAGGSLGGEITSMFINPAGLGFYKVSEIVLTPGFSMARSKSDYRETDATSNRLNRFNMSTSGFVSATSDPGSKWVSKAFSIAVNRTANFNNTIYYKGTNNLSSYSEQFAEELANSGVAIDDVRTSPYLSLGTKMAVYTYLIDTATIAGKLQVVGRPEYLDSVYQQNKITTKGGITELAIGFAANNQDKFYIGGSVGIPIVNYERTLTFNESDPSSKDVTNNFGFSRYEEKLTTSGVGLNAKLGIIFKPVQDVRIGAAIHTPTIYGLKEKLYTKMVTDVEKLFGPNDPGVDSITSDYYGSNNTYKFDLSSPWKFMVSGTYMINAVEDVTQQIGFLTADLEYVTYGSSRFSSAEDNTDDDSYYNGVNKVVKQSYKGALNIRVGGELKFNPFMVRLGYAHYGSPYKDKELKAGKNILSGGLGYRDKGIFIDLTYVRNITRNVNFPYMLQDKPNTFANVKSNLGQILLTFGFKI